jgi:CheY-like chemotaxis protein
MTPEVRARAFDPFFTTKGPSGTGLGLSQVYGTARQSGGDVSIRSQPGEGTEISLYLPRSLEIAHLASDDRPERVRLSRNGHETVLVVDDDDEVRQVTVDMLRHLGFVVVEADSGHAALDLIDTLPASPGFILLDYAMPEMSGLKLAQALRQRGVSAPMALVTGYADLSEADLVSAGFIDVLHKPFTMQGLRDLVVLLRQSIEERRPEAVSHSA